MRSLVWNWSTWEDFLVSFVDPGSGYCSPFSPFKVKFFHVINILWTSELNLDLKIQISYFVIICYLSSLLLLFVIGGPMIIVLFFQLFLLKYYFFYLILVQKFFKYIMKVTRGWVELYPYMKFILSKDTDFSDICYLYLKALPLVLLFPCGWRVKKTHFVLSSFSFLLIQFQQSRKLLLDFSFSRCLLCPSSF